VGLRNLSALGEYNNSGERLKGCRMACGHRPKGKPVRAGKKENKWW